MDANDSIERRKPGRAGLYYSLFQQLPELVDRVLQGHNIQGHQVRQLEGETNAVVEVASTTGKLIIKISPYDDLATERYFYEALTRRELPAPKVVAADFSRHNVPFMYEILEYIEGSDVDHLIVAKHERAGNAVGRILRRLHGIEVPGFGHPMPDGSWSHASFRDALIDEYFNEAEVGVADQVLNRTEIDRVRRILAHAGLGTARARLTHCDAGRGNFLFTAEAEPKLKAIIDPGGIIGGDPLWDLAIATNDFDSFGKGVKAGYTSEDAELSASEARRLKTYQLLSLYWSTCWHIRVKQDHSVALQHFRHLLAEVQ